MRKWEAVNSLLFVASACGNGNTLRVEDKLEPISKGLSISSIRVRPCPSLTWHVRFVSVAHVRLSCSHFIATSPGRCLETVSHMLRKYLFSFRTCQPERPALQVVLFRGAGMFEMRSRSRDLWLIVHMNVTTCGGKVAAIVEKVENIRGGFPP